MPWLVWLSGLSVSLGTKGSLVQLPGKAHAWVVGLVPSQGVYEKQISLPLFLLPFPSLKINKILKKKFFCCVCGKHRVRES